MKRIRDSGSPCLIPYKERMKPARTPLIINKNQDSEIHAIIHLHHLTEKSNF